MLKTIAAVIMLVSLSACVIHDHHRPAPHGPKRVVPPPAVVPVPPPRLP